MTLIGVSKGRGVCVEGEGMNNDIFVNFRLIQLQNFVLNKAKIILQKSGGIHTSTFVYGYATVVFTN